MTARHLAAQDQDSTNQRILYLLHAVGAPRCEIDTHGCTDGCIRDGIYNGLPPPIPQSAKTRAIMKCLECVASHGTSNNVRGGRVLCLDGGGIRGLVLIIILLHLEAEVNQPIIHCFDWVAGTSTGAILALALAAGKTLKDCLCLYFRMKENAFTGSKPYPSEPLENMLQQTLGSEAVMADIKHPNLCQMDIPFQTSDTECSEFAVHCLRLQQMDICFQTIDTELQQMDIPFQTSDTECSEFAVHCLRLQQMDICFQTIDTECSVFAAHCLRLQQMDICFQTIDTECSVFASHCLRLQQMDICFQTIDTDKWTFVSKLVTQSTLYLLHTILRLQQMDIPFQTSDTECSVFAAHCLSDTEYSVFAAHYLRLQQMDIPFQTSDTECSVFAAHCLRLQQMDIPFQTSDTECSVFATHCLRLQQMDICF
ncbi:85/88 kDa calcium-independent phospholipase A2 [Homalodisca vitripennis]|nr:85/88 kDa calcium-independent phospholipase A2 [Homalodisca vitripennis]